jgi:hypothetical protein
LDFGGRDIDVIIRSSSWCFVQEAHILEPRITVRIAPPSRNFTLVRLARDVTRFTVVDRRIVNHGIDVLTVERVVRKPVPRHRVLDQDAPGTHRRERVDARDVRIFRPSIEEAPRSKAPRVTSTPRERPERAEAEPPRRGDDARPRDREDSASPQPPPAPAPRRPPRAAEPRGSTSPSLLRQQQIERDRMEQRHATEREELEEKQRSEERKGRVPPGELRKRHEEEWKELEDRQRRGQEQLKERHFRQRGERTRTAREDKADEEDRKER